MLQFFSAAHSKHRKPARIDYAFPGCLDYQSRMGRCFLPQVNPPHYCQRGERISLSAFLTESITLQNTKPLPQQIKIPDLPPLILHEKSKDRGVFLFQRKDNINLKLFSKELKYSLTKWLHMLFSLLRRHRPRSSRLHLGLSCISLFKPQMAFLQSNPVICWGMQDLKNTTKIPSTFLLSRAGLEQQQHYGYFYSLSINTWAFAQCLTCSPTAEHATSWVHFWTGKRRATAMLTKGMAVLQESSAQFL